VISGINVVTTKTNATVTWTTDQNTTSVVNYGAAFTYGNASSSNALTRAHSIVINGLLAGGTYHFAVTSVNAVGVSVSSSDQILITNPPTPSTNTSPTGNNGTTGAVGVVPINYVNVNGTTGTAAPAAANGTTNTSATAAATPDNYKGLVICTGVLKKDAQGNTIQNGEVECDFNYFIKTIANLINWGFYISIPIVVVLFSWAGLLYISGVENNISRAKGIFLNAMIGFIIMLIAFTAVHTLVGWLVDPSIGAESLLSK
jgi:hypothetical protein